MGVVLGPEVVGAVDGAGDDDFRSPADFRDKQVRARFTPVAVKALFRIAEAWELTASDVEGVLGFSASLPTIQRWKQRPPAALSMDALQRISHVVNIYKLTHVIYGNPAADVWVKVANHGPICRGATPLDAMVHGGLPTMIALHEDLESMRGGY
jgi:hypothetical protein